MLQERKDAAVASQSTTQVLQQAQAEKIAEETRILKEPGGGQDQPADIRSFETTMGLGADKRGTPVYRSQLKDYR